LAGNERKVAVKGGEGGGGFFMGTSQEVKF